MTAMRSSQAQAMAKARNMALAGCSDLQGRSACQPAIRRQGERWIGYVGHQGKSGGV